MSWRLRVFLRDVCAAVLGGCFRGMCLRGCLWGWLSFVCAAFLGVFWKMSSRLFVGWTSPKGIPADPFQRHLQRHLKTLPTTTTPQTHQDIDTKFIPKDIPQRLAPPRRHPRKHTHKEVPLNLSRPWPNFWVDDGTLGRLGYSAHRKLSRKTSPQIPTSPFLCKFEMCLMGGKAFCHAW